MRIALAQVSSTSEPQENLALVSQFAQLAAARGADLVVFPEAMMCRFGVPLGNVAQELDGAWAEGVRDIAREQSVTVVVGMFTPAGDGRIRNTLLVTGADGETHYDKIHLYDAFGFKESDTVAPGGSTVTTTVDGVTIGLATCYDVRFPGLFQQLAGQGADLVVLPASWGSGPGKVGQWELLVRARALDAGVFVAACGQALSSESVDRRTSAPTGVGHSLVAGPMGDVVTAAGESAQLLVCEIDTQAAPEAREATGVLANRRPL